MAALKKRGLIIAIEGTLLLQRSLMKQAVTKAIVEHNPGIMKKVPHFKSIGDALYAAQGRIRTAQHDEYISGQRAKISETHSILDVFKTTRGKWGATIDFAQKHGRLTGLLPVHSEEFWHDIDCAVRERLNQASIGTHGVRRISDEASTFFDTLHRAKSNDRLEQSSWPWEDLIVVWLNTQGYMGEITKADITENGLTCQWVCTHGANNLKGDSGPSIVPDVDVLLIPSHSDKPKIRVKTMLLEDPSATLRDVIDLRKQTTPTHGSKLWPGDYDLVLVSDVLTQAYEAAACGWHHVFVHSGPGSQRTTMFRKHKIGQEVNNLSQLHYWAPEPLLQGKELSKRFDAFLGNRPWTGNLRWIRHKIDAQLDASR